MVEHAPTSFNSFTGTVIGLAIQTPLGNPQRQSWFLNNLGENGLVLASGGPLEVYHPPIENGPFLTTVALGLAGHRAAEEQRHAGGHAAGAGDPVGH